MGILPKNTTSISKPMRTITVGRDNSCDIVINDPRVSRIHANITSQNGSYIYRDMSTNGTIINGAMLRGNNMNIRYGDSVLLASSVALPWQKVQSLLPLDDGNSYIRPPEASYQYPPNNGQGKGTPRILNNWSWGGFYFGWLWAVFNGIYWPLIIFIPIIGWFAALIIAFILGTNGNRWAWEKKYWQSVEHFERVQKQWAQAALWCFLIFLFIGILCTVVMFSAIANIL